MSLFFPTSSFFESSGNAANEFPESLRDAIVQNACSIWSAFPNFVTNGRNPASSFARGYMNSACAPVQPPVSIDVPTFTGGQCCDKEYLVTCSYTLRRCAGDAIVAESSNAQVTVTGQIDRIELGTIPSNSSFRGLWVVYRDCQGTELTEVVFTTTRFISDDGCVSAPGGSVGDAINRDNSQFSIDNVQTTDGSADDCGNKNPEYPENPPNAGDLTNNVVVNINDGLELELEITYNQFSENYNFPMGFQVNGMNVVLDLSGLTIYGDESIRNPLNNTDVLPPGSGGGKDETGGKYTKLFPNAGQPLVPRFAELPAKSDEVEFILCNEGVIETITEIIKINPVISPIAKILIDILVNVVQGLCNEEEGGGLGFPEYYPIIPGTERPAIVYYYKELIDGKRQRSTYTSTVSNPTVQAVSQIPDISVPDKRVGKTLASVRMLDGSRLIASGLDAAIAKANLSFLYGQVSSSLLPSPLEDNIVLTVDERLNERLLNCSQIEYYPFGKASGVSPEIKRSIAAPE